VVNDQIEMHKLKLVGIDATIFLTFIDTIASIVVFENELLPCLCESV